MTSVKEASLMRHSPETGLRRMSHKKIKCAYPSKFSGIVSDSKIRRGRCPCNYLKTYHLRLSTIRLPHEILYCEKACGVSGEVLGARPGSRQVPVQGRDLRRIDQEEVFP
jgi:hypothetical protein